MKKQADHDRDQGLPELDRILSLARGDEAELRRWAVGWLLRTQRPPLPAAVSEALVGCLDDPDEQVVSTAILIIQTARLKEASDGLLRVYASSEGYLAGLAATALGVLGEGRLVDAYGTKRTQAATGMVEAIGVWRGLGRLHTEAARHMLRGDMERCVAHPGEPFQAIALPEIVKCLLAHRVPEDFAAVLAIYAAFRKGTSGHRAPWVRLYLEGFGVSETAEAFLRAVNDGLPNVLAPADDGSARLAELLDDGELSALTGLVADGRLAHAVQRIEKAALARYTEPGEGIPREDLFCVSFIKGAGLASRALGRNRRAFAEVTGLCMRALERILSRRRLMEADGDDLVTLLDGDAVQPGDFDLLAERIGGSQALAPLVAPLMNRLNEKPGDWRAVMAARLLAGMGNGRLTARLTECLTEDRSDELCETVMEILAGMGQAALPAVGRVLAEGDYSQVIYGLGVLERVPCPFGEALVLEAFDELWEEHQAPLLVCIRRLASRGFIARLRERTDELDDEGVECFNLLCRIHDLEERLQSAPGPPQSAAAPDRSASADPSRSSAGDRGRAGRVLGFMDAYYRRWLDTPLKRLSYRTPREAAAKPGGRKKVKRLLEDLELKGPGGERFPRHIRRLRQELGLDDDA